MTDDERTALQAEYADLKRKLAKRRYTPGFAGNAAEIEARMAEIEKALAE